MESKNSFFETLRTNQETYTPSEKVIQALAGKTIVMVVGPAGIGKSTTMNAAVDQDPRLHRVPSFTTRAQRIDDEPGMYHYVATDQDYEKLERDIAHKNVVQYGVSPVKDVVYGTYAEDYLREYNLKDVWFSAVSEFEKLNFKEKIVVGLVAAPEDWQAWLDKRFSPGDPEALSRLDEAELCLPWLIERKDVKWLQNKNDSLDQSALDLIDICLGGQGIDDGDKLAKAMLAAVPKLKKRFR